MLGMLHYTIQTYYEADLGFYYVDTRGLLANELATARK
jgi:hypothetical protein